MKTARRQFLTVSAVLFGWNLAWAWVILVRWGLIPADAAARTLLAAEVFFSRDPKLANLGFVWLPLPAFLQLPLVLVPGLWPTGLAGAVVSALAGALTGALINETARALGWGRSRYLLVAAFALNPAVIYVSASGLTEPLLMAAVLGQVRCFIGWAGAEAQGNRRAAVAWLVGLGVSSAVAVLTRYEGWFLSIVLALMVGAIARKSSGPEAAQASVLVYAAPAVYAAFLWAFFNWLIMGNPLYFLLGPYSSRAYFLAEGSGTGLTAAAVAVLEAGWSLSPLFFPAAVGLLGLGLGRRNLTYALVAAFWLAVPLFLALSLGSGQIPNIQYRYLTPLIAGSIVTAAVGLSGPAIDRRWHILAGLLLALLGPPTGLAGMLRDPMSMSSLSLRPFAEALLSGQVTPLWAFERELADYLIASGAGPVLTDTAGGVEMVVFFTGQPGRFILPADRDFEAALQEPARAATHVLVPAPAGTGALHRINQVYPELYAAGADWAVLEKEVGPYRLYRIPEAQPGRPGPPPESRPLSSDRLRVGFLGFLGLGIGLVTLSLVRRTKTAGG